MARWGVLMLVLSLCLQGQSLDDDFLPSGAFRDDILFDLMWPGPPKVGSNPTEMPPVGYESQMSSEEGVMEENEVDGVNVKVKSGEGGVNEESAVEKPKPSNALLPEDNYDYHRYVDMHTGNREQYRCVLPEIVSWEDDMVCWDSSYGVR